MNKNYNFLISENLFDNDILEFLTKHPKSKIYHHPAWLRAIQKSFSKKVYYLISYDNSKKPDGLLPLCEARNIFNKRKLVSFPFSTYTDPLMQNEKLSDAIEFLINEMSENVELDLRFSDNYKNELNNFKVSSEYCTHILRLRNSIDETFNAFHPTSVRASIRRAEKNNLIIKWDNSAEHLNIFYQLEFKLRKRLLLPPIPLKFYKNVYEELAKFNMVFIPVIYKDNIPIAAGFILNFKDTFYLEYTAADKNYFNLYPNHKLFFEVIKKAHDSGAKFVDFGRSSITNTSLITFKEKWAAERIQLYHHTFPGSSSIKTDSNKLKKYLLTFNSYLPDPILKLEGELLYRFFL